MDLQNTADLGFQIFFCIAIPLYELTKKSIPEPLPWKDNHEQDFTQLKLALQQTPALRLPKYTKLFTLFAQKPDNQAQVLTQEHGGNHRPIPTAYN